MNWQPIETAPEDRPILLRFKHEIGHYEPKQHFFRVGDAFYALKGIWMDVPVVSPHAVKPKPSEWALYAPA